MSKNEMISILSTLISPDNTKRQQAESIYNSYVNLHHHEVIDELLAVLGDHTVDVHVRSLSGVLIRRLVCDLTSQLETNSFEICQRFRIRLLSLWMNENNKEILKRLSHIISQISLVASWEELLPSLISHSSQSVNGYAAETILVATIQLIEILMEYNPDDISKSINLVGSFLSSNFTSSSLNVQQESSLTSLIIEERSKKKRNKKKNQSDQTGEANSSSLENALTSKPLSNLLIFSGKNLVKLILMYFLIS